jgi:hypothetical protein
MCAIYMYRHKNVEKILEFLNFLFLYVENSVGVVMFWSAHCSSEICRQRTNKFLVNFLKKICLFQRDMAMN